MVEKCTVYCYKKLKCSVNEFDSEIASCYRNGNKVEKNLEKAIWFNIRRLPKLII